MSPTRATLETPAVRAHVAGWLVDGATVSQVLARLAETYKLKVTRKAVYGFKRRHASELAGLQRRVVEAVAELTIADKQERIRRLAGLVDGMQAIVDDRGLLASEPKVIGAGRDAYEVTIERFDAALVAQYRGVLTDVAEELGQLPKTPKGEETPTEWTQINITVDNRRLSVTPEARRARRQERIIDG